MRQAALTTVLILFLGPLLAACQTTGEGGGSIPTLQESLRAYAYGNDEKAFRGLSYHAAQGETEAYARLGFLYFRGTGVEQDQAKAAEWFAKAAMAGEPWGDMMLAEMNLYGLGMEENVQEALRYFHKAAPELPYAQYRLGSFYYYGEYLEQDRIEGLRRWRLAAEGDEPAAQYALAKALVREGPRGTSSHGEALYWFQRAHLQASRDAGVGSDPSEDSSDWRLAKSAEAAFAHQAYLLGRDRRDGVGGPQDRVGAMMWFMIAANKGSHLAADALQEEPIGLSEMQVEAIKEEPIESALLDKGSNISTLHQDLEKAKHLAVLCEQSFYRHCG